MKLTTKNRAQSITVFIVATFVYFTLLLSCNLGPFSAKPVPGLATRAAYHVGSAVGMTWLTHDSLMIKILRDDFNSITPENCMKPALIHPARDIYYWKDGLLLAEFCKKNNFRFHGHTLIWHSQVPDWMKNFNGDSTAFEAVFKEHIQTITSRFKDYTTSWDVVNEAIADNDYSLESDSLKRNKALKMIADFQKQAVPLDGIGLQMHILIDKPSLKEIEETFTKFAQTKLLVHISELDISFNENKKETRYKIFTSEMADLQKQRYEGVVGAYNRLIPKRQQYGFTVWGFADKYSWIRSYHKKPDWPVLYDDSLQKKQAWFGFANGLEQSVKAEVTKL